MNINFKEKKKACGKPKKDVLCELEEYTKSEYESLNRTGVGYFARHGDENYIVGRYETLEDILDKIQELKKEMK